MYCRNSVLDQWHTGCAYFQNSSAYVSWSFSFLLWWCMCTVYNTVHACTESSVKDVSNILLLGSCFGAVPFCSEKCHENVKCTLKCKGRLEALRFALFVKSHKIGCLLISPCARYTEEFALVAWIWVWNTLRIKEPPISPMITQTALQAFVFRRSRRLSSWTSSNGQLQTAVERKEPKIIMWLLSQTWNCFYCRHLGYK